MEKISTKLELKRITGLFNHPDLKKFLWVIFAFMMTPSLTSTYNFYYTVELKFDLSTMSSIGFVSAVGYFLSIIALNSLLKEVELKPLFVVSGIFITILNFSSLFLLWKFVTAMSISTVMYCYIINASLVFVNELNFLPLMSLCCRLCPRDLEGTTYGLFTSIFNFGNYLASILASLLLLVFGVTSHDYSHLWLVVIIQAVYGASVLLVLTTFNFPLPDKISGDDQSIFLGDFEENEVIAPKRRARNDIAED